MRCGGEKSSSIWPDRILQIKAARKMADTDILAIRRITIALITVIFILLQTYFRVTTCSMRSLKTKPDFNHMRGG